MRTILILMPLVALGHAIADTNEAWEAFKNEYRKNYVASEERVRERIFYANLQAIAEQNKLYAAGESSYFVGVNKYADMLPNEFVATMNGYNPNLRGKLSEQSGFARIKYIAPAGVIIPPSIDWRDAGAVTPVKDQGQCGSCWAFSATGSLEGQIFRNTGRLVSLSEQNLVDCSTAFGNNGCNGGLMEQAYAYIKNNSGINSEVSYPYEATVGTCRFKREFVSAATAATGYVETAKANETDLMIAVATVGPISVGVDASHLSFQLYSGGIYNEFLCSTRNLNHAVLAVGYGSDGPGKDYWLVKNSWGTTWGDKGYMKMSRNKRNQCGIATDASYPTL